MFGNNSPVSVKKISYLFLGKPNGFLIQLYLQLLAAVFSFVYQYFSFGLHDIKVKQICARETSGRNSYQAENA